jgi:hypothetical protein
MLTGGPKVANDDKPTSAPHTSAQLD